MVNEFGVGPTMETKKGSVLLHKRAAHPRLHCLKNIHTFMMHRSYILSLLRLLLQLFVIVQLFCSLIGSVIMVFVGRTKKPLNKGNKQTMWSYNASAQ